MAWGRIRQNVLVTRNWQSLRSSASFEQFVLDQLADLGPVTSRKMFGGVGLYCGNDFFGIIARNELYLKVDDKTRREYEGLGMHAFKPYRDRPSTMRYWCVPIGVLESAPEVVKWARKAVAVAAASRGRTGRRRSGRSESGEQ
jgi:DNA transformation protein